MAIKKITIQIPVYFNQGSILLTYQLIKHHIIDYYKDLSFETIFIEDGSKDGSYSEILEVKKNYSDQEIKIVQFTRNFGQNAGFYAGLRYSNSDAMMTVSADLQEPPELLRQLIESLVAGEAPIIAGKRIGREDTAFASLTSKIFYGFMKKTAFPEMPVGGFDIAIINNDVKKMLLDLGDANPWIQGQLFWSGYPIKFVPYARLKREIGKSTWSIGKKLNVVLDATINYTYLPLRFFSTIGFIAFFLGVIYAGLLVINYFRGGAPFQGWTPIMMLILLLGGLQLVMLGLIGEYLRRNVEQTKKKPMYIVKQVIE